MLDHEAVSRDLVRALRGHRSQAALNRRLQYSSNVVYLWESGRRYPALSAFLWLAHRVGVDVPVALDRFQRVRTRDAGEPWTPAGAHALLRDVRGAHTATEVAARVGLGRQTVGRWFRGESEPDLPQALALVQACTTRALDFVGAFVDPAALPSTAEAWRALQGARALLRDQPWSAAVLLALELEAYRALPAHPPGWIARRLGLPEAVEAESLELLVAAGHARRDGERYAPVGEVSMDVSTPERGVDLRRWWFGVSLERTRPGPGCSGAWRAFTVSAADYERLRQLQKDYFRELSTLADQSRPREKLVLATMQLVELASERG